MIITAIEFSKTEYSDQQFKYHRLAGNQVTKVEFSSCTFKNCQFKESRWKDCIFKECEFQGCDFHLAQFTGSKFFATRFTDCQLVRINWTDTALSRKTLLQKIEFERCVLNYSTFTAMHLPGLMMRDCTTQDVDFSEADLTNACFVGTNLFQTRFASTNLSSADFRNARDYFIPVLTNKIAKAKFSLPEAMHLLDTLDIEISDIA